MRRERSLGAWEPGQDPGWAFLLLGQALSLQTTWTEGLGEESVVGVPVCLFCQLWGMSASARRGLALGF